VAKKVISECLRVLKPTGSLFYNHIDIMTNHLTIHPTWVYEFPLKQVIIWDKCGTPKIDKSYFLPFTEWIFWIKKEKDSIPYFDRNNALFKKTFGQYQEVKNPTTQLHFRKRW
jgi:DNA modification methylase